MTGSARDVERLAITVINVDCGGAEVLARAELAGPKVPPGEFDVCNAVHKGAAGVRKGEVLSPGSPYISISCASVV